MADPLSLVISLAKGLLSRVQDVKRNDDECQFLRGVVERTLEALQGLEGRVFDSPTNTVLKMVDNALQNAADEVERCCSAPILDTMLYNDSYTLALKHATQELDLAVARIPLAMLGTVADTQSELIGLSTGVRNARFEGKAETTHQTRTLKDAIESASKQSGQENAEIVKLIHKLLQPLSLSIEEIKEELILLRRERDRFKRKGNEEKETEEGKDVFELDTIIRVLSQSLSLANEAPSCMLNLEESLRCPISKGIMTDPVMLKESAIIYDRSSIEEWLAQGNQYDYVNNVSLESKDLVPIPALRVVCQIILEQFEAPSLTMANSQEKDPQQSLEPGLYEGHGTLYVGAAIVYASQLLVLEPNKGVVGCTSYKEKDWRDQENNVEIGAGEWDGNEKELSFVDNRYDYRGNIECFDNPPQAGLKWSTKVSVMNDPREGRRSTLNYSPPFKGPSEVLHPTFLQCEGILDTSISQVKYKSKLVMSLEIDSTIGGWTCFESSRQEFKFVGHIMEGKWDENGSLEFSIHFSKDDSPSNSDSMESKHIDSFKVNGFIIHDEEHGRPSFTSVVKRKTGALPHGKIPTPLNGLKHWDYPFVSEVCTSWHIHSNPSKLFQVLRNLELERSQYGVVAENDVEHLLGSQSPHQLEWSPLHVASENNSVSSIKEQIVGGADVNVQDKNGWTPLHIASQKNHVEIVKELIAGGAKADLQDCIGWTPLHIATRYGRVSIVQILIEHGALKETRNAAGMTPYDFVCFRCCLLPSARSTIAKLRAVFET